MNPALKRSVIALLAVVMLGIAALTLIAMVIAPPCTGIMHKADTYKISSLCIFLPAFYVLAWRRRSVVAAILIPIVQISANIIFINYINSLPLGCPQ